MRRWTRAEGGAKFTIRSKLVVNAAGPYVEQVNERYKVNVFILARSLRSDALAVTVTRQARQGNSDWQETTIARQVETDLENAILNRARQLKREWTAIASPK